MAMCNRSLEVPVLCADFKKQNIKQKNLTTNQTMTTETKHPTKIHNPLPKPLKIES